MPHGRDKQHAVEMTRKRKTISRYSLLFKCIYMYALGLARSDSTMEAFLAFKAIC